MYETHFGLKRRPFRALALGNDVFIGPQTATATAGIKKALSTPDAIVTVSGPVGGGKTTVVGRALEGVAHNRVTISIGRIKLGHDEVLELMLEELGVEPLPAGTVQRFSMFRRMLKDFADKDTQVFVVVEDAIRVGADALSELEALTAADAGVSDGANLILMGDPGIDEFLKLPGLARLKQRLRLRQSVESFSDRELLAYLKHCFRLAGGEFDSLFAQGSAEVIHALSGGIARMANNLVDSAMTAAAERNVKQVTIAQIKEVAASEYGLQTDVSPPPAPESEPVPKPVVEPMPEPEVEAAAEPVVELMPEPEVEAALEPVFEPALETAEELPGEENDNIPELIQDTLPDLEILAPQLANPSEPEPIPAAASEPKSEPPPEPVPEPALAISADDGIPMLSSTTVEDTPEEIPEWERDPTLAELRPDLEALEHAMAVAHGVEAEPKPKPKPKEIVQPADKLPEEKSPTIVPEITLDREIQAKIEEAAEALKKTEAEAAAKAEADAEAESTIDIAATGEHAIVLPPPPSARPKRDKPVKPEAVAAPPPKAEPKPKPVVEAKPAPEPDQNQAEMQQIAENLSRAKTLDDVDDKMAETLFGDEFSEIAAQIAAKVANDASASKELEIEQPAEAPASVAVPPESKLGDSAMLRLATVRALNGTPNETPPPAASATSSATTDNTVTPQAPATGGSIESIEDQINTSITQTLKALNVRQVPVEDDENERSGGFFGRFRKS